MNIFTRRLSEWKTPRPLFALCITFLLIYFYLWFRISPEEIFGSKDFLLDLLRNLAIVSGLLYLAFVLFSIRYLKLLAPVFITVAFLVAFDTVFLLVHFQNVWWPGNAPTQLSSAPSPDVIFDRRESPHQIVTYDYGYGFTNYINDTVRVELTVRNERLPDVFYITDEYGRRINTAHDTIKKSKYALFIGCSVTFGLNVADTATLPAFFQRLNPEYRSYNYGIPASGPNQYLARFQNENLAAQIQEQDGIAIYSFFEHHVNRAISDYYCYGWNRTTPYYRLVDDQLVLKGNFENDRWLISRVFDLFLYSYFIKYIHFNFPKSLYDIHYKTTAAIVSGMRDEYVKQFGNDQFYVFMMPGFETGILPYFEKHRLKVINCIDCIPGFWNKGIYLYPIDNHPTGLGYAIMADSLTSKWKRGAF